MYGLRTIISDTVIVAHPENIVNGKQYNKEIAQMADLRIVCTDQRPYYRPTQHAHIVAVGVDTDGDGYADKKHVLQDIVRNILNRTHRYYTQGLTSGEIALVEVVSCPSHCGEKIIRSSPDAVRDNNLDSMRRCSW